MKPTSHIYEKSGVITERDDSFCTLRLRLPGGVITPEQLKTLYETTQRYQLSDIHLTTRQTVEIPHIPDTMLPDVADTLAEGGCLLGAERGEVVNVTACPGNSRCRFSNIDSLALAYEIDKRYFGREMPAKVRIAVSACPNSCVSETLNEIGITGLRIPVRNEGQCTGCGTCVQYCREDALYVNEGHVVLVRDKCMHCGMCVDSCVYDILAATPTAYKVTLGGKRGRHPVVGKHLITVSSSEALLAAVDSVIDWIYRYASFGIPVPDQIGRELDVSLLKTTLMKNVPADSIMGVGDMLEGI